MTQGQIQRAFDAGRLTAREAADLAVALRPRPSLGAWRALAFVSVVAAASYLLFGVAFGWRLP